MKKTLAFLLLLLLGAGCLQFGETGEEAPAFKEISIEESRAVAEDYIRSMPEYREKGGHDLENTGTFTARCPYCWVFSYEFLTEDPVESVKVTLTVQEGEPKDVSVSRGGLTGGLGDLVDLAKDDLSHTLGIDKTSIEVKTVEVKDWSDTSLGCPEEGMMYAQVITPGFRVVLSCEGGEYIYHASTSEVKPCGLQ